MKYEEKRVSIKGGGEVVFRAPKPEDAEKTVEYLTRVAGESHFLANYPEEIRYTAESEEKYLRASLDDENSLMIVCEAGGEIVGNCQIVFNTRYKTRHIAEVMIALRRDFWGLGIGTKLFSELEAAGRARGVDYLDLTMLEGNERAEGLYRKMGYEVIASIPDSYRTKDGVCRAAVVMRKKL